ncbi:MAG: His/Gly/Thr/Pro-type tRNA ligase C-terminal domain-containing protein, partial [Patescibacteria group bacterium]
PKSVAPMPIHLISLRSKDADVQSRIAETTLGIYEDLAKEGIEALWDDRDASTGEKLADADLLGLPLRLLVSEKTLKEECVEWKLRARSEVQFVKLEDVLEELQTFLSAP